MGNFLQKTHTLGTNDVDFLKRIKLSAVLDLFQEIACSHADELGCGFCQMAQTQRFWVLSRVKFEISAYPSYQDEVLVTTWPRPHGNVFFEREYMIEQNGRPCINASSVWCVLEKNTQKVLPAKGLNLFSIDFKPERALKEGIQKIQKSDKLLSCYRRVVFASDLDFNDHVNNIRYADFFFDGLQEHAKKEVKSLQIHYLKQLKEQSEIDISYYQTAENRLYALIACQGEIVCEGEIVFHDALV